MNKDKKNKLLKECIRGILYEYAAGEDVSGIALSDKIDSPHGVYGSHFNKGFMYDLFIKPFVNLIGVTAGATKELAQSVVTAGKVLFTAVQTTFIPIMQDNYEEIFQEEQKNLKKIRAEYADVYKAVDDSFKNNDILTAAFFLNPTPFIAKAAIENTPKVAENLLSVVSGGELDKYLGKYKEKEKEKEKEKRSKINKEKLLSLLSSDDGKENTKESIIRENDVKNNPVYKFVSNEKVKAALSKNPKVQDLTRVGKEIVRGTLTKVYEQAKKTLSVNSIDDIQKLLEDKKIPEVEEIKKIPIQERKKLEVELLETIKKSTKEFYVKQLEAQVTEAIKSGVPEDHQFIKDYRLIITKIKAL